MQVQRREARSSPPTCPGESSHKETKSASKILIKSHFKSSIKSVFRVRKWPQDPSRPASCLSWTAVAAYSVFGDSSFRCRVGLSFSREPITRHSMLRVAFLLCALLASTAASGLSAPTISLWDPPSRLVATTAKAVPQPSAGFQPQPNQVR